MGLALEGTALVACEAVEEGMRRLDSRRVMVAGEDLEPACAACSLCYLPDPAIRTGWPDRAKSRPPGLRSVRGSDDTKGAMP